MLCHMKMDFQNIILGTYGKFVQNRAFSLICKIGHSALFWLNHFQIQQKKIGEYKVTPYVVWYGI